MGERPVIAQLISTPTELGVPALVGGFAMLLAAAFALLLRDSRARHLRHRVDRFVVGGGADPMAATAAAAGQVPFRAALSMVGRIGERVRRSTKLYSAQDLEALGAVLQASGFSPARAVPVVLGAKIVLVLLLPVAALLLGEVAGLSGRERVLLLGGGVAAGLIGPDTVVGFMRRRYLKQIRLGISDALDLLVVCSEAGMGLESALEQVTREMHNSNAPTAMVLSSFLDELRMLPDRREAFINFGTRLGLPELRRTATMLAQSQRYGAPLSQALRAVASELRRDRLIRMEEKAMGLPAMLIFPLILFILPTLFIVLIGPAALRMMDAFKGFPH